MPPSDDVQQLVDQLVACDEQPSEEELTDLRNRLKQRVTHMKRRGQHAMYVCVAAAALMLVGYVTILIAANGRQDITWLVRLGFGTLFTGAILGIFGCIGLLLFRGFGFVWARYDFQEATLMELSLQIQRLTERLDERSRNS